MLSSWSAVHTLGFTVLSDDPPKIKIMFPVPESEFPPPLQDCAHSKNSCLFLLSFPPQSLQLTTCPVGTLVLWLLMQSQRCAATSHPLPLQTSILGLLTDGCALWAYQNILSSREVLVFKTLQKFFFFCIVSQLNRGVEWRQVFNVQTGTVRTYPVWFLLISCSP